MSTTVLYVVRHGQSTSNVEKRFHDDRNDELTTRGIEDAIMAAKRLEEQGFICPEAIYCSPYERARATCSIVLESIGQKKLRDKVIYDDRLAERDLSGLHGCNYKQMQWERIQYFKEDEFYAKDNGVETLESMENRVRSFLDDVKEKHPNQFVLVFTHGLIELAFWTVMYGRPGSGTTYDLRMLKNGQERMYFLKDEA